MYCCVWRQFNKFIINLDVIPETWEERATLFIGYLVQKGMQSGTVKSYISGIKKMLLYISYEWDDNKVLLASLMKACKLKNDRIKTRLPIDYHLLEQILKKVDKIFNQDQNQPYLATLYMAMFAVSYYGLLRVGEATLSPHAIKAKNVYIGLNKKKIKLVLYSSKTHSIANRPQKIKIASKEAYEQRSKRKRTYCPFRLMHKFMLMRGDYINDSDQFFVFRDGMPVTAENARTVLREAIAQLGLDNTIYDFHSFRIGRSSDMAKFGYSLEEIKRLGRWRSNIVYKYIRLS